MWTDRQASYERVAEEPIGWLTTVSGAGVPSTAPVWFLLEEDDTILMYSRDPSVRVRNLGENDRVTLHLEGDGRGGAIVVMNGRARVDAEAPPASGHTRFITKYQGFLDAYGWTPAWFAEHYPTPVRMVVSSVRGS